MPPTDPYSPSRFDASQASPELRAICDLLAQQPRAERPPEPTVEAATLAREQFENSPFPRPPECERAEDRTIPGPDGDLPIRVILPPGEVRGAMLHIHGGGWVLGDPKMSDAANEKLANDLGLAVVSVDYRLAPEAPYPAGPDDCEAAAVWLVENAKSEFGAPADRIVVGGESAGGHLTAVTTIRMKQRHGYSFRAANVVYGLHDLSGVPSHSELDDKGLLLDSANIDWFTRCFVHDPSLLRDPDVSPLYADLTGMPPALFTVGTFDPLIDHSLFMHARWAAAGNVSELQVFPGAPHGFDSFPVPEGIAARKRMVAFLGEHLSG
jgi:acetyl esterase/lipase